METQRSEIGKCQEKEDLESEENEDKVLGNKR